VCVKRVNKDLLQELRLREARTGKAFRALFYSGAQ
jgi:hypothetical protein